MRGGFLVGDRRERSDGVLTNQNEETHNSISTSAARDASSRARSSIRTIFIIQKRELCRALAAFVQSIERFSFKRVFDSSSRRRALLRQNATHRRAARPRRLSRAPVARANPRASERGIIAASHRRTDVQSRQNIFDSKLCDSRDGVGGRARDARGRERGANDGRRRACVAIALVRRE